MSGAATIVLVVMLLVFVSIVMLIVTVAKYVMRLWRQRASNQARPTQANEYVEADPPTNTTGARTFVEATDGGWGDPPESVAVNGGSQADYVVEQLRAAQAHAQKNVAIGETFNFTITNIPAVMSPHEIMFGMMMQADSYGLRCGPAMNERFTFTRIA